MKLLDFLFSGSVSAELESNDKSGVLGELVDILLRNYDSLPRDEILSILLDREKIGSTGIGDGVAIPHGKSSNIPQLMAAFGRSTRGIDFDSIDGKKVHFFCLLLAPEDSIGDHLKALARISRLFKNPEMREQLMQAKDSDEILTILAQRDAS